MTTPEPASAPPESHLPGEVRAWGAVSLFSDLSHEAVTSVLPIFLAAIGGSPVALGAIEGSSDALSALAKLWGGRIADRARHLKPPTVVGYVLTGLAVPAIAVAHSWIVVAVFRALGWMGRGFRSPLRDTLLTRATPAHARGRAFGLERALDQIGAVLAPLTVFLLLRALVDLRTVIALSLLPALASLGCLLVFVRERPSPAAMHAPPPGSAASRLEPPMRRFLAAVAVFGAGDFAKTLLVLWALGPSAGTISPSAAGGGVLLYAFFNVVTVVAAYGAGRLSDTAGRRPVLVTAYVIGAAGAAVPALFAPGWLAGLAALGLSGLMVGAEESIERAWAADLAGGRHGRAFGLLHAINGVGDLVASLGVGIVWTWAGPGPAFGAAAVLMVAGAGLTSRVPSHGP